MFQNFWDNILLRFSGTKIANFGMGSRLQDTTYLLCWDLWLSSTETNQVVKGKGERTERTSLMSTSGQTIFCASSESFLSTSSSQLAWSLWVAMLFHIHGNWWLYILGYFMWIVLTFLEKLFNYVLIDGLFPQLSLFIDSVKQGNIWENMI